MENTTENRIVEEVQQVVESINKTSTYPDKDKTNLRSILIELANGISSGKHVQGCFEVAIDQLEDYRKYIANNNLSNYCLFNIKEIRCSYV